MLKEQFEWSLFLLIEVIAALIVTKDLNSGSTSKYVWPTRELTHKQLLIGGVGVKISWGSNRSFLIAFHRVKEFK